MYDIIVGRNKEDRKKLGTEGTIFIGKHYVKMGQTTSLSNSVFMDVTTSHVVFICGKRGGGKSYTMGVMAEGFSLLPPEVRQNLSIILLDTMGVYWTMGHANQKEAKLLEPYGIKPAPVDFKIFTPEKYYKEYKKRLKNIDHDAR